MIVLLAVLAIGLLFAGVAFGAWILMLLLGLLASLTGWACAIGFWASFVICFILQLFIPRGK